MPIRDCSWILSWVSLARSSADLLWISSGSQVLPVLTSIACSSPYSARSCSSTLGVCSRGEAPIALRVKHYIKTGSPATLPSGDGGRVLLYNDFMNLSEISGDSAGGILFLSLTGGKK